MNKLSVKIAGIEFKNPVITASGSYGFGREYSEFYPLSRLGGISLKGTTIAPRMGNEPPRIAETPSGILNSIGLQNPGVDALIADELGWLSNQDTVIISNIAGSSVEDYAAVAERLEGQKVDMIEVNISCPNVKSGGMAFGTDPAVAAEVTKAVRRSTSKPVIMKLSPNVTDITEIAKAVEAEGADAVSLINTITGMRIDINTRRPILKNNTGGMSGSAVFPVAVRMVNEVYRSIKLPIIGMGGISTWQMAVEMMLAGASAVQVGTAMFSDAYAPIKIIDGLEKYAESAGFENISEITGKVNLW